jgi:RNA polymerase sigma-54 factor
MPQTLSLTLRPELRLSAVQILTVRLLVQPLAQLEDEIEQALDDNEFLERVDAPAPASGEPAADAAGADSAETDSAEADDGPGLGDLDLSPRGERTPVSTEEREPFPLENLPGAAPSLAEHLREQLRHATPQGEIRTAGEAIIGNLDDNGYLRAELGEIAAAIGVSAAVVTQALAVVQAFDPIGVAARSLRECLVLQLRADPTADPLAVEIVERHCEALAGRRYEQLARALRAPLPRILAAAERIRRLDPKPGRAFGGAEARPVEPEVIVQKIRGEYVVTLKDEGLPMLRVARAYRGLRLSPEERAFVAQRRQAARWFVEAIERRRQTIRRVVETVVQAQRDFFDHGPGHLRPLGLRDVAEAIAMHESTVSRAISSKYVETPHGVFPLRHFIQPGVPAATGDLVATVAVKAQLRALIDGEDGRQPLSDLALAAALRQRGFVLARRTVAKYRSELRIPPCYRRVARPDGMPGGDVPISLN